MISHIHIGTALYTDSDGDPKCTAFSDSTLTLFLLFRIALAEIRIGLSMFQESFKVNRVQPIITERFTAKNNAYAYWD